MENGEWIIGSAFFIINYQLSIINYQLSKTAGTGVMKIERGYLPSQFFYSQEFNRNCPACRDKGVYQIYI
jgi:hypothetical protein